MENHDLNLLSRFRGAILGGAVADALALPYQHYSRAFLRSLATPIAGQFGTHHSGFYPLGQYTDETQTMLCVLASILEAGEVSEEAMASRLASLGRDQLLVEPESSIAEALNRLQEGSSGWQKAGLEPGRAEAAPAARVLPVALWDHEDFDVLCKDAEACARITHKDPRSIASALAVAGAIASNVQTEELVLGNFLDRVSDAAGRFDSALKEAVLDFPRVLSLSEQRALRHFESLSPDDRYPATDEGLSGYSIPTVSVALYYFLKSPYSYEKTVESCLRLGGQIDTPAFLAGAISGALLGENGIPAKLTEELLNAGDIALRADQLYSAWLKKSDHKRTPDHEP
jgi:ADP-ribosylglycohydrolase